MPSDHYRIHKIKIEIKKRFPLVVKEQKFKSGDTREKAVAAELFLE